MYVWMYIYASISYMYVCIHIYILNIIHAYVQKYIHTPTHTHTYTQTYRHTYKKKYIHTYMNPCIHTYISIDLYIFYGKLKVVFASLFFQKRLWPLKQSVMGIKECLPEFDKTEKLLCRVAVAGFTPGSFRESAESLTSDKVTGKCIFSSLWALPSTGHHGQPSASI